MMFKMQCTLDTKRIQKERRHRRKEPWNKSTPRHRGSSQCNADSIHGRTESLDEISRGGEPGRFGSTHLGTLIGQEFRRDVRP